MEMIRIGICDDESMIFTEIRRELELYKEKYGTGFEFFTFNSGEALIQFFQNEKLDLLFMDIDMPEKNGIELAAMVTQTDPECQIAYCTNYLEFATDVYETRHCYYILKSQFTKRLPYVMKKVQEAKDVNSERIFIERRDGREMILKKSILYMERSGKKTYIYLEDHTIKETTVKLDVLMERLNSKEFVRCHNSFIVSFGKVKKYSRQKMEMDDGQIITISRTYIESVKKAFAEWNWNRI